MDSLLGKEAGEATTLQVTRVLGPAESGSCWLWTLLVCLQDTHGKAFGFLIPCTSQLSLAGDLISSISGDGDHLLPVVDRVGRRQAPGLPRHQLDLLVAHSGPSCH